MDVSADTARDAVKTLRTVIETDGALPSAIAAELAALTVLSSPIPDELIIPLRKPIPLGPTTYSELRLREPTAGEIEQWDGLARIHADRKAVSVVSGTPEAVVRQIPAREFYQAARYIGRFLD